MNALTRAATALIFCGLACCAADTFSPIAGDPVETCDAGALCRDRCVDLRHDAMHCGACGAACGEGQSCAEGRCVCTDASQTRCDGTCVDTRSESRHCGGCRLACSGALECHDGSCVAPCRPDHTRCDGVCVSLTIDPRHCGACGRACPLDQTCAGGACECASGLTWCPKVEHCVDLRSDGFHCGGCNNRCPNGAVCNDGHCRYLCPPDRVSCSDECIAPLTDSRHCGACGNSCPFGAPCVGGRCVLPCPAGQSTCAGRCIDVASDVSNCGRCGTVCTTGRRCLSGVCELAAPPPGNDTCDNATPLAWGAGLVGGLSAEIAFGGTTQNARQDFTAPPYESSWSADVYYRFTLDAPAVVYADTVGSSWDTMLAFADTSCRALPTTPGEPRINDDACGLQSQVVARLGAGTWHLVVGGYLGAQGPFVAKLQRVRAPSGTVVRVGLGTSSVVGTTAGTTGALSLPCGGNGPEDLLWWTSCGGPSGTFRASTCGTTTWNTVLGYIGPGGISACSQDACGLQSDLAVSLPSNSGFHALYIDGYADGRNSYAGSYAVAVTRP